MFAQPQMNEIPHGLEPLWSAQCLDDVEASMLALAAGTQLDRAGAMVQEHLSTGGKRLRARLALAALEALGGRREDGVAWATAVELLHNATLVHDDVQDGDTVRRGKPTVWARHGVGQALNVGDLMLMLPFLALEGARADPGVRWHLTRCLAGHASAIVRGQSEEMELLRCRRLDWSSYRAAAMGKTGGLFTLPVEGAALMAGRSKDEAVQLGQSFRHLGLLFQVADDVLDLYADKGRGEVGCDLREGKVSALVVAHLARVPGDTPWLVDLLEAPRDATSGPQVAEAIRRFRRSGALADVLERGQHLVQATLSDPVLKAEPRLRDVAGGLAALVTEPLQALHETPRVVE